MNRAATKIGGSPGAEHALGAADRALVAGVRSGDRRALAKAITLIESTRRDHQARGQAVLEALLPHTGQLDPHRHQRRAGRGQVDVHRSARPASDRAQAIGSRCSRSIRRARVTGGSILGDKTRMEELVARSRTHSSGRRPPAARWAAWPRSTREALLVCEAAGFDVIIVETVGVGQSRNRGRRHDRLFVLLQLPNAGDDLQAIKKGIVELADIIVDQQGRPRSAARAELAQHTDRRTRSRSLRPASPQLAAAGARAVSALQRRRHRGVLERGRALPRHACRRRGEFAAKRRGQALDWMWALIDARPARATSAQHPGVGAQLPATLDAVAAGHLTPAMAAERLLARARND